jgi:hypothetical protein
MEFRSVQGMERLRPQQDGMVELLVVVVGGRGFFDLWATIAQGNTLEDTNL